MRFVGGGVVYLPLRHAFGAPPPPGGGGLKQMLPPYPYSEKPSPRYRRRTLASATSSSGLPANSTRPS